MSEQTDLAVIKDGTIVLNPNNINYPIDLKRCDTYPKLVEWAYHLAGKSWVTSGHIKLFVDLACKAHGLSPHGHDSQGPMGQLSERDKIEAVIGEVVSTYSGQVFYTGKYTKPWIDSNGDEVKLFESKVQMEIIAHFETYGINAMASKIRRVFAGVKRGLKPKK